MRKIQVRWKAWFGSSLAVFLLLLLIHLALPLLFVLFRVPSFALGRQGSLLRWQNDATGSGIQFNLLLLFVVAVVLGFILAQKNE